RNRGGLCPSRETHRHDREQREEKDETKIIRGSGEARGHRERRATARLATRRPYQSGHRGDARRGWAVGVLNVNPNVALNSPDNLLSHTLYCLLYRSSELNAITTSTTQAPFRLPRSPAGSAVRARRPICCR